MTNTTRLIFLLTAFLCFDGSTSIYGVTLVEDGKPRAAIVLPDAASPAAKRASAILQSHIRQISGANLTIRLERDFKTGATKEQPLILVGEGKLAKELGFTTAGLGAGGFHLEAKENVLALLGTDLQTPADTGGTLYATSTFLEEKLGVRYLWPGETGKVVPRRRTIEIADFKIVSAPAMVQRNIRSMGYSNRLLVGLRHLKFARADYEKLHDEAAKTEADTGTWFAWQRLGGTLNLHSGHAFGQLWDKYGKDHPDWFALQPNGSRDQSKGGDRARLCKSNPELIAAIARDKIEEFKENPGLLGVSLGPNDGGQMTFCTCPKCEALDAPGGRKVQLWDFTGKERRMFEHVSLTDRMVYFWNAIAEQVTKVYPDKLFVVDAYSVYAAPPVQRTLHPNFVVRFAALSYGDEADRQQSLQDWDGWAKAAKRIFFRSNLMLAGRRTGMPLLYAHRFAEDFRHLASHGMMGTDFDSCCHNWATQGLNYYVVAKLHWDPSQNVDGIIDDYCRSGFGPAAKTMRLYYDKLEGNFTASAAAHQSEFSMFTDAVLSDLHKLIDQAKAEAAKDEPSLRRVEFVEQGLRWTDVEVRAHRFLADPDHADPAAVKRVLDERYALQRELFEKFPLAVNVAYVSWGEDSGWSRLKYRFPE
jgi:hypothetical protein